MGSRDYPSSSLWRPPVAIAVIAVGLVLVVAVGFWFSASGEKAPETAASPKATPSLPQVPGGQYGYAASRKTDPEPLTTKELFGKAKITNKGRSYRRTTFKYNKVCKDAISGAKIEKALKAAGCTQLIRASFRDAGGKVIGTVGVANLKTSAGAKKVATAGAGDERKDFLKPLPGTDEISKFLGQGEAYAGGWYHGHYAVLLWFQFKDGHKPEKAELKRLTQAAVDITDQTVFAALDRRSIRGAPA
ncbi:hypothetical protein Aph01nite_74600 [Acrocarpospora phusangensis]|uniref:Uncharacterized protein n=1 Tax=Acrocarpospora phusangensis TaxID=1070424 RepID=A0A919UV79_9ACTN|nr:hypothetical protein [Acrocarpospora phusangensis]GIH29150.1 hypothetical protein Aph01nite_74600 [Acrocarpospora phusangensis]